MARPYAMAWRHLEAARQSEPLTITLTPEAKITGRVNDQEGRPVRDAEVRVSCFDPVDSDYPCSAYADPGKLDLQKSRLSPAAKTDAEGNVTIGGLPRDKRIILVLTHENFRREVVYATTTDRLQPDNEVRNYEDGKLTKEAKKVYAKSFVAVLRPPLPKLIGRVLAADTKKPLPNARITGWGVPDTLTDRNGQFVVREAQQSQCHAIIYPPEGSDYLGRLVFIDVPRDKKETHVDIELPRGEVVSGIVVDGAGQGAAGVAVSFDSGLGLAIHADTPERVLAGYQKTGSDGRFRIAVPPGKGRLVISGPVTGYDVPLWRENDALEDFSREINVATGQPIPEVKFTVQRMASDPEEKLIARRDDYITKARKTVYETIEGKVVDPDGNPVVGASVSAEMRSGGPIPYAFTQRPTGKDGRWVIHGVPDVPLTLMAYIRPPNDSKDRRIRYPAHVEAEPGQMDVRIVLDPKLVRGRSK